VSEVRTSSESRWRREYEWAPAASSADHSAAAETAGLISACLVVHNEAGTIGRCLESLRGVVDECIVVHDGPCVDRTLDIARDFGCRVVEAPHYGHCERHTPLAYETARGEWILNLDADEFLSAPLAAELRALTRRADADGYEFLWPHWDGRRYVTSAGPHKLALFRRSATRMVGLIHVPEEVSGRVVRVPLLLEHRPQGRPRRVGALIGKFRRRAPLHAREYVEPLDDVPRFNYPGVLRWTPRREWTTRWSPLLIVPAALHTFYVVMADLRSSLGTREALRFAASEAVYRGMVTALVAWYRYARPAREGRAD
jgi:hypothetical protein